MQIILIGFLNRLPVTPFPETHILKFRGKSRMTTVVGPVRIQYPDLRHRGIPLLLFRKIILNVQKILERHRQTEGVIQFLQFHLRHVHKVLPLREILQYRYIRRLLVDKRKRIWFHHIGLSRIHRIDTVSLDPRQFLFCDISVDQISHSRSDNRFLVLFQKLHALYRGIRPLVKLPRQKLHGKDIPVFRNLYIFPI